MKKRFILLLLAIILVSSLAIGQVYDRKETLYAGGGLWSPPNNWNPFTPWAIMTGTNGLIYEYLFMFDPLSNEMIPWLAVDGGWIDEKTYELKLRDGVYWTDGEEFNAEDVKFTFDIAKKYPGVHYSSMWNWMKEVEIVDRLTVRVHFTEPLYQQWSFQLYQLPMVPEHIWKNKTEAEILTGANEGPIGTGCYTAEGYGQDRMIYLRNENWWAIEQLGIKPTPKRIVYLTVSGNNVALGMIFKGELDISNFFLPGVPAVKSAYGIHTYFDGPPYMLSDNTAVLFLNNSRKPMDDVDFRKAVAWAINADDIVTRVFENQVIKSNPLGFLPIDAWMKYYDEKVVEQYGFKYDPSVSKKVLADAGYKDINGDGFVEAPDGSKIELSIIVPFGWTDWMESIKIIANNLNAVGINAKAEFPDYSRYQDELYGGNFDMAINNFNSNLSNTVWSYYYWLFWDIREQQTQGNYGKYNNPKAFELMEAFDRTPVDDYETGQKIMSELEELFLKEIPYVPLWFNGMWFQASTNVWTNWPSEHGPHYYPCTWNGKWQLGGIFMLTALEAK